MTTETDRAAAPPREDEDDESFYPGDVEEAMPEGEISYELANYVKSTLRLHAADPETDSVHANMPIYYQRGTKHLVAPDTFFARGARYSPRRRSYRLWVEKVVPQVVFEIVSRGHEAKDVDVERFLLEKLGVREYYWFNPDTVALAALELDPETGTYAERAPDERGRYLSPTLGLEIGVENDLLALYRDGVYLPPPLRLIEQLGRERDQAAAERDQAAAERDRIAGELDRERRRREELERRLRELEGGSG